MMKGCTIIKWVAAASAIPDSPELTNKDNLLTSCASMALMGTFLCKGRQTQITNEAIAGAAVFKVKKRMRMTKRTKKGRLIRKGAIACESCTFDEKKREEEYESNKDTQHDNHETLADAIIYKC